MGGIRDKVRGQSLNNINFMENPSHVDGHLSHESTELPPKSESNSSTCPKLGIMSNQLCQPFQSPMRNLSNCGFSTVEINNGIDRLSKQVAKVSEMSSLLGRAGSFGLEKAIGVLDRLGTSMTNMNNTSDFTSGVTRRGNKISILAFEVANTIVKGVNLIVSLSEKEIRHLKEVVFQSEGVNRLISEDMDELLKLAAADKREEWEKFTAEVVRFGNYCYDPQWHSLERYFVKLGSIVPARKCSLEEVELRIVQLMTLVPDTAELYHELRTLDKMNLEYQEKLYEENSNVAQKGELAILKADLKSQRRLIRSLQKKSLWSKMLEEVIENLIDIVHFSHLKIHETFGRSEGDRTADGSHSYNKRLGPAGMAMHYASIITQIDTLASQLSSAPSNTRDALYQGLPKGVKSALRIELQPFQVEEELLSQIRAEMEKHLQWLVPISRNTIRGLHGFGWVGDWANSGFEKSQNLCGQRPVMKIETLHYAREDKIENYVFQLVLWLHHLFKSHSTSTICSSSQETCKTDSAPSRLLFRDQEMLQDITRNKYTPGISKSQRFNTPKTSLRKHHRLSKSSRESRPIETKKDNFAISWPPCVTNIDFDIDRIKALDIIDGLATA